MRIFDGPDFKIAQVLKQAGLAVRERSRKKSSLQSHISPFTSYVSRFLGEKRERRIGKDASLCEEAVLADSGRAGEIAAGAGG